MIDFHGRNTVWGFNERALKNLRFLIAAREEGEDVHIVTALVTSLLGLIVFPYAEIRERGDVTFKKHTLKQLQSQGWPAWAFTIGSSEDLDNLLWHLRNAISHRLVYFHSESGILEEVEVQFSDRPKLTAAHNWRTTINAAELKRFILKLSELLKPFERDNS